jgi:hypothetical protein
MRPRQEPLAEWLRPEVRANLAMDLDEVMRSLKDAEQKLAVLAHRFQIPPLSEDLEEAREHLAAITGILSKWTRETPATS